MTGGLEARRSWTGRERLLAGFGVVLFVLTVFDAPTRSLWLGEALAAWTSSGTPARVAWRALHYQGQSPFFFLAIWPSHTLFPGSEFMLRLPSIVAYGLGGIVTGLVAARLFDREAGFAAAFMMLGIWPLSYGRLEARPYSIAVLAMLLATWFLLRWCEARDPRHLWAWAVFLVLTLYGHVLFAPVLGLHAVLIATRIPVPRPDARALAGAGFVLAVGAIPTVLQLMVIRQKWTLYSFAEEPTPLGTLAAMVPGSLRIMGPLVLWFALWGLLVQRFRFDRATLRGRALLSTAVWVLLPPLALAVVSEVRGSSIFVPRYYSWQFAGTAVFVAGLLGGFRSRELRLALYTLFFAMLVGVGWVRHSSPVEDWEGTLAELGPVAANGVPVLVWTGLAETKSSEWTADPEHRPYHLAPVTYYGLPEPAIPLALEPEGIPADAFLQPAEVDRLVSARRAWVVVRLVEAIDRSEAWMAEQGFRIVERREFGSLTALGAERVRGGT